MTMPARRCLTLALAIALPVAAAGCRDQQPDHDTRGFRDRYVDYLSGALDAGDARKVEVELARAVDGALRKCMSGRGFELPSIDVEAAIQPATDLGNREWVAEYGFGISTVAPPSLADDDPMADYLAKLGPSEAAAFEAALGSTGEVGCIAEADSAARRGLGVDDLDRRYALMRDPFDEPEMHAAEQTWRDCVMAAAGVTAGSLPDLVGQFATRVQRVQGDIDRLRELQREEVNTALATFDCNVERNLILARVTAELLMS